MIIDIDDKLVSSELLTECFDCDYETCGGVCCVSGDSGAPITVDESNIIKANIDKILPYMNADGKAVIAKQGVAVTDRDGDLVTPLVRGDEECAYAIFDEQGNCFCAIERAFLNKTVTFRKPVSCHLYPIRTKQLGNKLALNYDRWSICQCARDKGKREGKKVYQFLRDAIIRVWGEPFYKQLEEADKLVQQELKNHQ